MKENLGKHNKVLITGCSGFIGWKTTQKLLEKGFNVIGVDNNNDYYDVRLKKWRLNKLSDSKNFEFFKIDIEDKEKLKKIFSDNKFDAVINLAARAGVRYSIINPEIYYTTNVLGTLNLLELCKEFTISKFILASTSSLYAGHSKPFDEKSPVNKPISPYAASKKAAEVLCYTYHYFYKIDVTVFRYFTVYGPAGRPDMSIFRFIKWIMEDKAVTIFGDGTQNRDFTYVDDIAEGTVKGMNRVGYEIINLGGGKKPRSINEVISIIEKISGKKAKINYLSPNKADMKSTQANIVKAKKILNWYPKISLEEGINESIKWYKENKDWLKNIKV